MYEPAVDVFKLGYREEISLRIETVQVAEHESEGVADLPVGVDELAEYLLGYAHIHRVVGRNSPEPNDIGTVLLNHLFRGNGVAERLGHLFTLAVHREAVGEYGLIGGTAPCGNGCEQG